MDRHLALRQALRSGCGASSAPTATGPDLRRRQVGARVALRHGPSTRPGADHVRSCRLLQTAPPLSTAQHTRTAPQCGTPRCGRRGFSRAGSKLCSSAGWCRACSSRWPWRWTSPPPRPPSPHQQRLHSSPRPAGSCTCCEAHSRSRTAPGAPASLHNSHPAWRGPSTLRRPRPGRRSPPAHGSRSLPFQRSTHVRTLRRSPVCSVSACSSSCSSSFSTCSAAKSSSSSCAPCC